VSEVLRKEAMSGTMMRVVYAIVAVGIDGDGACYEVCAWYWMRYVQRWKAVASEMPLCWWKCRATGSRDRSEGLCLLVSGAERRGCLCVPRPSAKSGHLLKGISSREGVNLQLIECRQ
jgi:hypothetical protein